MSTRALHPFTHFTHFTRFIRPYKAGENVPCAMCHPHVPSPCAICHPPWALGTFPPAEERETFCAASLIGCRPEPASVRQFGSAACTHSGDPELRIGVEWRNIMSIMGEVCRVWQILGAAAGASSSGALYRAVWGRRRWAEDTPRRRWRCRCRWRCSSRRGRALCLTRG